MKAGDILYFWGEDTPMMVVMANDKGVRYYETDNATFDDKGSIITKYASYEMLDESCSYVANIDDVIHYTIDRSSTELTKEQEERLDDILKAARKPPFVD